MYLCTAFPSYQNPVILVRDVNQSIKQRQNNLRISWSTKFFTRLNYYEVSHIDYRVLCIPMRPAHIQDITDTLVATSH